MDKYEATKAYGIAINKADARRKKALERVQKRFDRDMEQAEIDYMNALHPGAGEPAHFILDKT